MKQIYSSALEAVDPERAVLRHIRCRQETLIIGDRRYPLVGRKVYLVGGGKAAVPMARAVERMLGTHLEAGLVIVKYEHGGELQTTTVLEAGHPEPDEKGVAGTRQLLRFLEEKVTEKDLLLVVISGGGSALLPAPVPEISFEDKRRTTALLLRSGATIHEINAIRKHLSHLKGGRLLNYTRGAEVVSLLLSDVVGDDLASIASGPTAPDPTTFADCLSILDRYRIATSIPESVLRYLKGGAKQDQSIRETPKPGDPRFRRVQNLIVGSNLQALQAASEQAAGLGFTPLILSSSFDGDTAETARAHVAIAREILSSGNPLPPPCCLISGGETTVRVTGRGKGGRNQEFALQCAFWIRDWDHAPLLFASLGSDGNDGPTDAAGAVAFPDTVRRAESHAMSIRDYLHNNDAYHFFNKLGDLIITGPTQTNVMDLRFVVIGGKQEWAITAEAGRRAAPHSKNRSGNPPDPESRTGIPGSSDGG